MNVGWIVLLIGAEYTYAHQNVNLYELEPDYTGISPRFKKVLTLQILHRMVTRFSSGEEPLSAKQLSQQLEIPVLLVQHILNELVDAGLVSLTDANGSRDPALPALERHTSLDNPTHHRCFGTTWGQPAAGSRNRDPEIASSGPWRN